jgi:hypothetical protein
VGRSQPEGGSGTFQGRLGVCFRGGLDQELVTNAEAHPDREFAGRLRREQVQRDRDGSISVFSSWPLSADQSREFDVGVVVASARGARMCWYDAGTICDQHEFMASRNGGPTRRERHCGQGLVRLADEPRAACSQQGEKHVNQIQRLRLPTSA